MNTTGIAIQRYPYEEPYHLNLAITASNGIFRGRLEYYCNTDDLQQMGAVLKRFPQQAPDEYVYQLGSANPEDRFAFYLALRVFTTDSLGHCALSITMNNNRLPPDRAATCFCMKAEASAINRLGELLVTFGQLGHRELIWEASGEGHLNEDIQKENGEQGGPGYPPQGVGSPDP